MGGCVGGEGSEEARADAAATEREREREREWEEAADAVAYDSCTWPPPVVAVCGPGNSGKSAFSRLLLNTLVGRSNASPPRSESQFANSTTCEGIGVVLGIGMELWVIAAVPRTEATPFCYLMEVER